MIGIVPHRARGGEGPGSRPGPFADLHDAAARWRAPDSPRYAAANIVALRRPRGAVAAAPAVAVNAASRAAGALTDPQRAWRWLPLLVLSLAAHASFYLPFRGEPEPMMASIGEVAISAELVLGANQDAGLVPHQGTDRVTLQASAAPQAPNAVPDAQTLTHAADHVAEVKTKAPTETKPLKPTEQTPVVENKPVETKAEAKPQTALQVAKAAVVQAQAAVKTVTPVKPVPPQQTLAPAQVQAVANAEIGELLVSAAPQPAEVTAMAPVQEQAEVKPAQTAVAAEKPPQGIKGERNDSKAASPGALAAGGAGRGASSADSNYIGQVSKHLNRRARPGATPRQGTVVVAFSIDGSGRVLSAAVSKSSGSPTLDREATDMVERASPFPAPPNAEPRSFSVPVRFQSK